MALFCYYALFLEKAFSLEYCPNSLISVCLNWLLMIFGRRFGQDGLVSAFLPHAAGISANQNVGRTNKMEKNSEFGSRLRALVIAKGGTDADLECLLSEAGAADFDCIAASVVGLADFIEIDVDYGASEEDYAERFRALIAKGAYIEYCNLDVTPEHFPSGGRRGVHRRRIQLFQPDVIEGKGYWTNQNVRDGFVTN